MDDEQRWRHTDGWMNEGTDGRMDGWLAAWADGYSYMFISSFTGAVSYANSLSETLKPRAYLYPIPLSLGVPKSFSEEL